MRFPTVASVEPSKRRLCGTVEIQVGHGVGCADEGSDVQLGSHLDRVKDADHGGVATAGPHLSPGLCNAQAMRRCRS